MASNRLGGSCSTHINAGHSWKVSNKAVAGSCQVTKDRITHAQLHVHAHTHTQSVYHFTWLLPSSEQWEWSGAALSLRNLRSWWKTGLTASGPGSPRSRTDASLVTQQWIYQKNGFFSCGSWTECTGKKTLRHSAPCWGLQRRTYLFNNYRIAEINTVITVITSSVIGC